MLESQIRLKVSLIQRALDILRQILGLQTQLEKSQTEAMVRGIAKNYKIDVEILVATLYCESGMDPKCITRNPNGTTDYGLCQFNDYWYKDVISSEKAFSQPQVAVNVMCKKWEEGRANDWICFRNKNYLQYLNVKPK